MAATDVILAGEDRELGFELYDAAGVAINNVDLVAMIVWIYTKSDNQPIAKFSKLPLANHDDTNLVIADVNTNEFIIRLQAESTRGITKKDDLLAEVKGRYANTDYSNNDFDVIDKDTVIAQIKPSLTGSIQNMGN